LLVEENLEATHSFRFKSKNAILHCN